MPQANQPYLTPTTTIDHININMYTVRIITRAHANSTALRLLCDVEKGPTVLHRKINIDQSPSLRVSKKLPYTPKCHTSFFNPPHKGRSLLSSKHLKCSQGEIIITWVDTGDSDLNKTEGKETLTSVNTMNTTPQQKMMYHIHPHPSAILALRMIESQNLHTTQATSIISVLLSEV